MNKLIRITLGGILFYAGGYALGIVNEDLALITVGFIGIIVGLCAILNIPGK